MLKAPFLLFLFLAAQASPSPGNWQIVLDQPNTVLKDVTLVLPNQNDGSWLCLYDSCRGQAGGLSYGGGILVLADNVTIENVRVLNGNIGIAARGVKGLQLVNDELDNQSAWGIYLFHVSTANVQGNQINSALRACPQSTDGCESAGVLGLDVQNSQIADNNCFDSGDCYYFNGEGFPSNDNEFLHNTCVAAPHNCFEITYSQGNHLDDNASLSTGDRACLYPFWVGGSVITFSSNHWSCIKSIDRAYHDSQDSTSILTTVINDRHHTP